MTDSPRTLAIRLRRPASLLTPPLLSGGVCLLLVAGLTGCITPRAATPPPADVVSALSASLYAKPSTETSNTDAADPDLPPAIPLTAMADPAPTPPPVAVTPVPVAPPAMSATPEPTSSASATESSASVAELAAPVAEAGQASSANLRRPSTRDQVRAAEWIQHGAKKGEPWAYHMLGELYLAGLGVPLDPAQAAHWFQRGADEGVPEAQTALARLYLAGHGVAPDLAKAVTLLQQAAEQGQADGQYLLGELLLHGKGVEADPPAAIKLWKKAAKQGNADAMHQLGEAYQNGSGVTASNKTAVRWLYKAGFGYLQDKRLDRARQTLAQMQALAPDNAKVTQLQGALAASL